MSLPNAPPLAVVRTGLLCVLGGLALGTEAVPLLSASTLHAQGRAAHPVSSTHASTHRVLRLDGDDFSDLEFLREELRDVRIVQLGESGHGMAEASRLKARLVRFLHEEMGFGVVAFESSLYQCHDADSRAAVSPARATLLRCVLGVWHTEEVLPLFEHIRVSRTDGHAAPLHLAGIDVQPIGPNKDHRPGFLGRAGAALDPATGARIADMDSTFLAIYARGGSERRSGLREKREALVTGYEAFADTLDANLDMVVARLEEGGSPHGRTHVLVAAQTARSMAAYVRQQTSADMGTWAESRDRGMAENAVFLSERLFPGEKVVVWAANYHVRHSNEAIPPTEEVFPGVAARAMGGWLRDRYADALFTVGVYAAGGEAVDNARTPYAVVPPPAGSLEALSRSAAAESVPAAYFALRPGSRPEPPAWAANRLVARYNGRHPQWLVPGEQYDALVILPFVTPPIFLY